KLVPLTSALSLAVRAKVADLASSNFRQKETLLSQDQKIAELQWIIENAWRHPVPTDSFYASASQIILSRSADQLDSFRKALTEYIRSDGRLGDPRLRQNTPKW